ncbi:unnamed protein product [Clavelina lepadiformis]|uniref:CEP152 CEP63 binding coiled coil domain-containing protein n=1 Tax=Clavelina lepadiformis TaxID=159417 RepID=A0ABP0FS93_CLALP
MMSVIHPGSSINFDGADLQRSEEEEFQREDIKQQQELHELLSAELPDDLLDDDPCNGSHTFSGPHDQRSYENSCDGSREFSSQRDQQSYESSPGWRQQNNIDEGGSPAVHSNHQLNGSAPYYAHSNAPVQYMNGPNTYANSYSQDYTDAEKWQMQQRQQQFDHNPRFFHNIPMRNEGVGEYGYHDNNPTPEPDVYGFSERREAEGSEDFDAVRENHYQHYDNKMSMTLPSYSPGPNPMSNTPGKNVRLDAFSAPTSPYNNHYPMNYKPINRHQYIAESANTTQSSSQSKSDASIGSDYVDATDRPTLDERGDAGREVTQLRILYEARGKKIDKLTREISALQEETDREKRILNHQLAMEKDQRVGMSGSLEECQRLLVEKDRFMNDEEGRVKSLQIELETLKSAKVELVKKLEVSERTVENLQQEMAVLQRSDALERARQQHEAVLATSNERHEQEILEVTSMLDEVRRVADEKTEESEELRRRLKTALKDSEETLLEKTETINRLSRNLEDAQNHCQTLLAGSGENVFLQRQLSDVSNEKTSLDERNKVLQVELDELREQISMYESAYQLGVTPRPQSTEGLTDSYAELMGVKKKIDWKTPKAGVKFKGQTEDLVESLRHELERALANNKTKRDQVSELQNQVRELNDESRHWRGRVDDAEKQAKLALVKTSVTSSNRGQIDDLQREFEESLERVDVAEERSMRLEETCRDLKQQMCELVEQHDANKQEAVDRCERACMQLHEDSKRAIREEMLAECEQKMYEASVDHEGQILDLKKESDELSSELSEVKQSYVQVCSEKDNIEGRLRDKFEKEKEELLNKFAKDKEEIKASMEKEWDEIKKQKEKEQEQLKEDDVNTRIALAKVSWMEEHASLREESIRDALKAKEEELTKKIESLREQFEADKEKEFDQVVKQEKLQWEKAKDKEIQARLNELYEELKEDKQTAVTAATSIAQLNWMTEHQNNIEEECKQRMEEAQKLWQEEHDQIIDKRVKDALQKMQNKIEVLNEERDNIVKEELARAEREWKRKKEDALKRKEEEMKNELKRLQEFHQKDYEAFTAQHKMSLEKFLEGERSKQTIDSQGRECSLERDQLLHNHKMELERLQRVHDERCEEYRQEIKKLTSSCDAAGEQMTGACGDDVKDAIARLEEKHTEDTEKLKSRMKDEYRRWKRERSNLRSQLDQVKGQIASKPQETVPTGGGMDPAVFLELRQIYVGTLGSIKSEMLDFVRESRLHSMNALKREGERERHRVLERLKHRRRKVNDSVLPSFLVDAQSFYNTDRFPSKLLPDQPITAFPEGFQPIRFQSGAFRPTSSQSSSAVDPDQSKRGRSRDKKFWTNH